MVQQRKRKSGHFSSPPKKAPSAANPAAATDSGEEEQEAGLAQELIDIDPAEIAQAHEVGNSEFDVPFDLTGIPEALRETLLAAAPVLRGRDVEYDDAFFHEKVGLCDRGPTVDDVAKVYPEILDNDIKRIWRAGAHPNYYEIAQCTNKEQARLFSQHNYRVYGNRPDNAYFAMRFLKAAFATFVHGKDVNWVAEAQGRRTRRFASATKNPRKLGPVALRRQVEGLCQIVATLAAGSTTGQPPLSPVQEAEKNVQVAAAAEASKAEMLREIELQHLKAMDVVNALSEEKLATLEAESTAAMLEQKKLYRTGTPSEYKAQAEVARSLSMELAQLQEQQMCARDTIRTLLQEAGPLAQAVADHSKTKAELAAAEAALNKTKLENLVLRPRPLFEFPVGQSVPAIESGVLNEVCAICSKGFVAKAAIMSSCGCLFHNICVGEMIDVGSHWCPFCAISLDAAWVAQWDGTVKENHEPQIEGTIAKLKNVAAAKAFCHCP